MRDGGLFMSKGTQARHDWEEVSNLGEEWNLYKRLIAGIPEDIAVKDLCLGHHWVYIEADCGCGMAMLTSGGMGSYSLGSDPLAMSLRDVACQVVSWNFMEASVGVAALNAWYSSGQRVVDAGMKIEKQGSNDGFELYRNLCSDKKVTVVGHFPLIERLAGQCELTILERSPQPGDMPDPACEFIIPYQDFTFITGITLINKTLPRLLQLAKGRSSVIMVGPSVVPAPLFYEYGVDCMAGSYIDDPATARAAISQGYTSDIFKHGVQKMRVERPGWLA
jgi:uncharacterized protein (DUF4213/DUF364 family)